MYKRQAWYCLNLWDHYQYTMDKDYLEKTAYPVMKSAVEFWMSELELDEDGLWVAPNSWSPEQSGRNNDEKGMHREKGSTYTQTLVWQLFRNTIEASETLGLDENERTEWKNRFDKIDPGLRVSDTVKKVLTDGTTSGVPVSYTHLIQVLRPKVPRIR